MPGNDFYQVVALGFAPKLIGIDPMVLSGGRFDDYYASEPPQKRRVLSFQLLQYCVTVTVHRVRVTQ